MYNKLINLTNCCALTTDADNSLWNNLLDCGKELKTAFEAGGFEECRRLLERKRDEWMYVPLNVAVIGNSGSGKSSFINAIRGLTADEDGAAPVGVHETTLDIESYPHPNNQLVKLWDLPGVGTNRFRRKTYLSDIHIDRYDFFLLITADRFTENDTWLGNEFRKRNKKYFFVRTKIGDDILNNKKAHPGTHKEEAVVREIRESTKKQLRENGFEDVAVFLIDSYECHKFEFSKLEEHFLEKFNDLKRSVLILSMHATSKEMIGRKVKELRSRIWMTAALSAMGAPVTSLFKATPCHVHLLTMQAGFYCRQLGLDETSLKRYAVQKRSTAQSIVGRCLACGDSDEQRCKNLVESLVEHGTPLWTPSESTHLSVIRFFLAAPQYYEGTYHVLEFVLRKMESAALEIVKLEVES